jgi:hypothetical protein
VRSKTLPAHILGVAMGIGLTHDINNNRICHT